MTLAAILAAEPRCGCPGSTALRVQRDMGWWRRTWDILALVECARCRACWVWGRA